MQTDEPTFEAVIAAENYDPREGGVWSHAQFMADHEHDTWLEMVGEILNQPVQEGGSEGQEPDRETEPQPDTNEEG